MTDENNLFKNLLNKPLEELNKTRKMNLALQRVKLSRWIVEMCYKYDKKPEEVLEDLDKVFELYDKPV